MADYLGMRSSLIFGKIKYVKDEIVTSTGFTEYTAAFFTFRDSIFYQPQ